jgi:hypothetical protein
VNFKAVFTPRYYRLAQSECPWLIPPAFDFLMSEVFYDR